MRWRTCRLSAFTGIAIGRAEAPERRGAKIAT
jgi:hypothetical protein